LAERQFAVAKGLGMLQKFQGNYQVIFDYLLMLNKHGTRH